MDLKHCHPFRCPVFTLDLILADRKKIPRWEPRSQQSIFLGKSRHLSGNISLVLNCTTRNVILQFHLVFDDSFTTVTKNSTNTFPTNWDTLFEHNKDIYQDFAKPLEAIIPNSSKAKKLNIRIDNKELIGKETFDHETLYYSASDINNINDIEKGDINKKH